MYHQGLPRLGNHGMWGLEAEVVFHTDHQTPPVCVAEGGGVRSGGCLGLIDIGSHECQKEGCCQ